MQGDLNQVLRRMLSYFYPGFALTNDTPVGKHCLFSSQSLVCLHWDKVSSSFPFWNSEVISTVPKALTKTCSCLSYPGKQEGYKRRLVSLLGELTAYWGSIYKYGHLCFFECEHLEINFRVCAKTLLELSEKLKSKLWLLWILFLWCVIGRCGCLECCVCRLFSPCRWGMKIRLGKSCNTFWLIFIFSVHLWYVTFYKLSKNKTH